MSWADKSGSPKPLSASWWVPGDYTCVQGEWTHLITTMSRSAELVAYPNPHPLCWEEGPGSPPSVLRAAKAIGHTAGSQVRPLGHPDPSVQPPPSSPLTFGAARPAQGRRAPSWG